MARTRAETASAGARHCSGGSWPRTPTMAGAIRLRARKVPQAGAHTPAPRSTTTAGPSSGTASSATRSLSARMPAAGNSGLGRVGLGLGDRDRVVGVGAVDDPAGPQHHRGRPGGGLQRAPGPVDHPGPAALLVAVGGVDQREQDHGVHPGQGLGEGRVARPGLDELELGARAAAARAATAPAPARPPGRPPAPAPAPWPPGAAPRPTQPSEPRVPPFLAVLKRPGYPEERVLADLGRRRE